MLTNAAVKAARPRASAYKLADAGGLHLYVAPTGLRSWRWRFRVAGKEQLLTIGSFPDIGLDQARAVRDEARELLARGEDPRVGRSAEDPRIRAFESIGRRWHTHMLPRWTPTHAADVLASLERDVFPAIGAMPIKAITPPVLLTALRAIEERGSLETARRVHQRVRKIFGYAIAEDLTDTNPAALIAEALTPPPPPVHHPALLEIGEARALLAAAELVGAASMVKLGSRFLALTAVRLAAVLGMRWSEVEDLDGSAPTWRVPAARMKLRALKKLDAKNDHVVPLSWAAVEVLRQVRDLAGGPLLIQSGDLVFEDDGGPLSDDALRSLYIRAGYAGRHVPHGWRATFATILNERFPEDHVAIDRALAHSPKDKVAAAYDRSAQLARRRRLFQAWADELMPPAGAAAV